jgi:hypothetical protein
MDMSYWMKCGSLWVVMGAWVLLLGGLAVVFAKFVIPVLVLIALIGLLIDPGV